MKLRPRRISSSLQAALLLAGLFAFAPTPPAQARAKIDCAPLYRLLQRAPATPPAEEAEQAWRQAFTKLGGKPAPAPLRALPQASEARAARIAAAEAALPWSEEARIVQGEQLLEMRAQVTRQGNFRNDELDEWVEVLELRNARRKILNPDPDGPDFLAQAARYAGLSEEDRLRWVQYFGRSEHEEAYPVLANLYRKEPSPKIRETLTVLAQDRGFELDSQIRARDLTATLSRIPRLTEHQRANLRSLRDTDLDRLLLSRERNVRYHARAGLVGRSETFLETVQKTIPDPEIRAAAAAELKRRSLSPPPANLNHPDARLRAVAAAELRPAENPEHLAAFRSALQDPVAEVKLAALGSISRGPASHTPELRRTLRALGKSDESIRVRRRAHDLLEPYARRSYEIAPSRTWMLDAMRRKFPTHIKLPPERARDMELMLAASHVYDAPELEGVKTAAGLLAQHRRFLGSIPADYEVSFLLTDPSTGFKAAIYRPTSAARAGQPAVVAIGGTQTGKDVLADLNWGVAQAKSPAYERLLARVQEELKNETRPVAVTGHSLGGGLAQIFGYDLARALKANERSGDLARFRVVSWNGFGAREALQKLKRWNAADAEGLPITSYFHPDDVVSKLGTHLGQTLSIRARAGQPRGLTKLKESHVIKAVQDLFQMEHALMEATPAPPKKDSASLRALEKFAGLAGGLTDRLLSEKTNPAKRAAELRLLAEARHEWAKQEGYRQLSESYDWLSEEMGAALAHPSAKAFAPAVEEMEAATARLKAELRKPAELDR